MRLLLLTLAGALVACQSSDDFGPTMLNDVAGPGSAEPHLAPGSDGKVVMSWLESTNDGTALRFSRLENRSWLPPVTIAVGSDWFVNWADFPSVVPIDGDLWAAHWLVKKPGSAYSYDIAVALSRDGGATWGEAFTPHDDGTATEHGFVTLYNANGNVGVLWLDGRHTMTDTHGEHSGGMTLRSAHFSPDGNKIYESEIDELVCDCCQTDVAVADSGPLTIYRDRTEDEIRDIYTAGFEDGTWQTGSAIADDGWRINACPVNGPALDARANRLVAAWFTAAGNQPRVRFAASSDGGASFSEAIDIDTAGAIGRVDTSLLNDGSALVSWLRKANGNSADVVVRNVAVDGTLGPVTVVATTAAGRMSGFPQMLVRGEDIVFAWTDIADDIKQVKTATISVAEVAIAP